MAFLMLILATLAVTAFAQENDYGYVGTCGTPSLAYCRDIIKHEVPALIAQQSQFLESSIKLWVDQMGDDQQCREGLKRALCKQRFPSCSKIHNIVRFEAPNTCENDIHNCNGMDNEIVNEICSSYNASLYLGTCHTLKRHFRCTGRWIVQCDQQSGETKMTDWMYRFLALMDSQLKKDTSFTLKRYGRCYNRYVQYRCDFGHCEGHRVISSSTQESCNNSVLGW